MEKSWKIEKRSLESHRKIIEVVLEGLWELCISINIMLPLLKGGVEKSNIDYST